MSIRITRVALYDDETGSEILRHDPSAFQFGDRVRIARKVPKATGWDNKWLQGRNRSGGSKTMDQLVGMTGTVIAIPTDSGVAVAVDNNADGSCPCYAYPSCALDRIDAGQNAAQASLTKPKPGSRRKRVGPGPWDSAPCTHLRWNLMGLLREKIVIGKTAVEQEPGAARTITPAELEIECPKCNVSMKLRVK